LSPRVGRPRSGQEGRKEAGKGRSSKSPCRMRRIEETGEASGEAARWSPARPTPPSWASHGPRGCPQQDRRPDGKTTRRERKVCKTRSAGVRDGKSVIHYAKGEVLVTGQIRSQLNRGDGEYTTAMLRQQRGFLSKRPCIVTIRRRHTDKRKKGVGYIKCRGRSSLRGWLLAPANAQRYPATARQMARQKNPQRSGMRSAETFKNVRR